MGPISADHEGAAALVAMQNAQDLQDTPELLSLAPPTKAPEWQHVHIIGASKGKDPQVSCKFCGHTFVGGVTRIKNHLGKVKKAGVAPCLRAPEELVAQYKEKRRAHELEVERNRR
jgi:hypothetical protein